MMTTLPPPSPPQRVAQDTFADDWFERVLRILGIRKDPLRHLTPFHAEQHEPLHVSKPSTTLYIQTEENEASFEKKSLKLMKGDTSWYGEKKRHIQPVDTKEFLKDDLTGQGRKSLFTQDTDYDSQNLDTAFIQDTTLSPSRKSDWETSDPDVKEARGLFTEDEK